MQQFNQIHQTELKVATEPASGGFPDHGNGWYADKLPYKDWYKLNNSLRVHQNFVETLPTAIVFLLMSGLYFPKAALLAGSVNCIAKPIYSRGYVKSGPNGRILGALSGGVPLYGLGFVTIGKILLDFIL